MHGRGRLIDRIVVAKLTHEGRLKKAKELNGYKDPAHTTLEHRFGSTFAPTYDLYLTLIVRRNALFHAIEGQFGRDFNFVDYFGHFLQILVSDSKANVSYSVGILLFFPTMPPRKKKQEKRKSRKSLTIKEI